MAGAPALGAAAPSTTPVPVPTPAQPYRPKAPLALAAQTSLGEDHFLLAAGVLDPVKDKVFAYRSGSQRTEAMVVRDGILHQLRRNDSPGAATTWTLVPVVVGKDAVAGVSDVVAGTSSTSNTVGPLEVVYRANGEVVQLTASGDTTDPWAKAAATTLSWPNSGPLRANYSAVGGVFVYSFTSLRSDHTFTMFWWHAFYDNPGTVIQSGTVHFDNGNNAAAVRWTNDPSTGRVHNTLGQLEVFFAAVDDLGRLTGGEILVDMFSQTPQQSTAGDFTFFNGPSWTACPQGNVKTVNDVRKMDDISDPIVVVTLTNGQVWCVSMPLSIWDPKLSNWFYDRGWLWLWLWQPPWGQATTAVSIGTHLLAKTEDTRSPFANANKMLDIFVTQRRSGGGHLVGVVRQHPWGNSNDDSTRPQFYAALPLHGGVAVVSVPGIATPSQTLITVADDGTLVVLEQDAQTTLWSETTVHFTSTESLQVSCHRVQVSITDARGMPVPNAPVTVTAAAPVSALLSASNSTAVSPAAAVVMLGDTPIKLVSDAKGQVTVAVPATGLSVPDLTFTVSANGLSASGTVGPAGAVTTYLAGGTPLGTVPALTTAVLAGATTDTGSKIVPATSPSQVSVSDAVGFFNGAAQAGIKGSKTGFQSTATRRPLAVDATPKRTPHPSQAGWESGLSEFFGDLLQGIRSGATQVVSLSVSTVSGWALTITTTVGGWASQALDVVVSDLESAGHVFHALFNAIGAEIMDAIHWLEAKILAVLKDTVALAANFDVWLDDWTGWMKTQIEKGEKSAQDWFGARIKDVDTTFSTLIKDPRLTGVHVGTPPPKAAPKGTLTAPAAPPPPSTAAPDPHHSWLRDKMTDHQVAPTGQPTPLSGSIAGEFTSAVNNLKTNLEGSLDSLGAAGTELLNAVQKIADSPSDIIALGVPALLQVINDFIDAVLKLGDSLITFVLDLAKMLMDVIKDFLNVELPSVPIISALLSQDEVGFKGPLTVGKVATLMAAFPVVVAYKIAHLDASAAPFKGTVVDGRAVTKATSGGLRDSQASSLQDRAFVAAGVTWIWTLSDTVSLMKNADAPPVIENDFTPPSLDFFGGVDLVFPCLVNALTYPTDDGVPFSGDLNWGKLIGNVGWLCGFGFPIITVLAYHWKQQPEIKTGVQAAFIDRGALAMTSILGVGATFFNLNQVLIDIPHGFDPIALVLALVGDLGAAFAFLGESNLNKTTEGVSSAIASVITLGAGAVSAVLLPEDVS